MRSFQILQITSVSSNLIRDHAFSTYASFQWVRILRQTIKSYAMTCTCKCAYQRVRNVSFLENSSYIFNGWSIALSPKSAIKPISKNLKILCPLFMDTEGLKAADLLRDILFLTLKFLRVPNVHLIDLAPMKDWVDLRVTYWSWNWDPGLIMKCPNH